MEEIKLKISPQGMTFPLEMVPALYEALRWGRPADDETPCRACDIMIVRGLLCGDCSVSQTLTEAYNKLADAVEAAEERAAGKTAELLGNARKAWQDA